MLVGAGAGADVAHGVVGQVVGVESVGLCCTLSGSALTGSPADRVAAKNTPIRAWPSGSAWWQRGTNVRSPSSIRMPSSSSASLAAHCGSVSPSSGRPPGTDPLPSATHPWSSVSEEKPIEHLRPGLLRSAK